MKRYLLFGIILSAFAILPSMADMTVEESTDPEYMMNSGYSQMFVEDVFMQKNRFLGKPIEPLYEKSQNKFVVLCKKLYGYIDPGYETQDKLHHDIKDSPSFTDL